MTAAGPLHERLTALDEAVASAKALRSRAAQRRRERARVKVGFELTRPLRDYCQDVHFGKRPPDEDEHRRIVKALVDKVVKDGLLLDADGRGRIRILDPEVENEEAKANRVVVAREAERREFLVENSGGIAEESREYESQRFKEAVVAGDLDAVREALAPDAATPENTLTTADLHG